MKNFRYFLAAGLILASALTSACTATDIDDREITAPPTAPAVTSEAPADPNVPQFVVTEPAPGTEQQEGTKPEGSAPDATEPKTTDTETTEPEVNEDGMIVDDWRSDINITGQEDPAELYDMFGIDADMRKGYYNMICADSALPIIHISTENKKEILSLDDYVNCIVEVMNCDEVYKLTASAGIRVRGNASAYYGVVEEMRGNQLPYRIKFNEKQTMLGLNDFASCKSWVLLRTYDTGVKDHLAFNIARAVNNGDYYVSDSTYVQVYLNEKYAGLYLLCEQTQENSDRIDITEAEDGYEGTDIGYLVELDNYATGDDDPYFWLNFNLESITDVYGTSRVPRKYSYSVKNDLNSDEQLKFIERYFEIAWEIPMRAIKYGEYYTFDEDMNLIPAQDEFASAYDCVNAIFDVKSVVDMYIAYEIVNDQDVGGGSFYFAVDFSEKSKYPRLTMVSPWDFDWAYTDYNAKANGGLYVARFKDDYFVENWGDRSNPWLILFYSADWFQELVKETWRERLPYIRAVMDDVENTVIDFYDDFNKDGVRRSARSVAIINWARDRVDYLDTLWG